MNSAWEIPTQPGSHKIDLNIFSISQKMIYDWCNAVKSFSSKGGRKFVKFDLRLHKIWMNNAWREFKLTVGLAMMSEHDLRLKIYCKHTTHDRLTKYVWYLFQRIRKLSDQNSFWYFSLNRLLIDEWRNLRFLWMKIFNFQNSQLAH